MLALAWVYRAGRDFFDPQAGLVAALVLASSVVFLAHMEHRDARTSTGLRSSLR